MADPASSTPTPLPPASSPPSPPPKSSPSEPQSTLAQASSTVTAMLDSLPTLASQTDHPTDSHALARADHVPDHERPLGAAQVGLDEHGDTKEVKDLGWHTGDGSATHKDLVPQTLVGGITNDDLWTLVRRFNKQIYHVRAIDPTHPPPGNLDLYVSEEEEFSPDKLRSTIERLYMTVIVGLASFGKHIARLRSWNEKPRTATFCLVYFLAWFLRLLLPTFLLLILVLILSPRARLFIFPPAPLSLISAKSGTVQTPPSGQLGSTSSLTGAPEANSGEAVEQEATNFVAGLAGIAVSTAAGKAEKSGADEVNVDGESDEEDPALLSSDGDETAPAGRTSTLFSRSSTKSKSKSSSTKSAAALNTAPDPADIAFNMSAARRRASTGSGSSSKSQSPHEAVQATDATAAPVNAAMSSQLVPILRILCDLCDTWEKVGNALSPSPPFPRYVPKLKLAGIVAPALLGSFMITPDLVVRGATFGMGAAFFALPWIEKGAIWIDAKFPGWRKALELRNHVLRGVPTNAQLTVTLLRIGEVNKAPIPPPPQGDGVVQPDKEAHEKVSADDLPMEVSQKDVDAAVKPESSGGHGATEAVKEEKAAATKPKKGSWILGLLKGTTRTTVSGVLGADRFKAAAGSQHAKRRLGVVASGKSDPEQGPIEFVARYKGKKGKVIISTQAVTPSVGWVKDGEANVTFKDLKEVEVDEDGKETVKGKGSKAVETLKKTVEPKGERTVLPGWSVLIRDVKELRKVGGLGWKGRLVVGWALGMSLTDGLEITDTEGKKYMVTAVQLREELFNRLVAMGDQKWEVC